MLGRTPLSAAIRALRAELEGGPRADLGREVRELAELLAHRETRRAAPLRDPVEQELLSAIPDAAALVSKEGWVRVSNAAFDTLAANGRAAGLTPLEFRLLTTFMARLGRVQSREQLLEDVWEMSSEVETRTVDTHVKRLREKLGSGRDLLETVRGIGYRLVNPGEKG